MALTERRKKKDPEHPTFKAAAVCLPRSSTKGVLQSVLHAHELGLGQGVHHACCCRFFSEKLPGPVFFAFIQRQGGKCFGKGNFKVLFESLERDPINRSVLQAE